MTPAKFKNFCSEVRKRWSPERGLIALCKSRYMSTDDLRLSAGKLMNKGSIVAEACALWEGDDCLYEGPLNAELLKEILTQHGICLVRFTTSKDLDTQKKPVYKCFGNSVLCKSESCPCHK